MNSKIQEFVGKTATVWAGGLEVEVLIKDVKQSYGKTRYQVTPVAGKGEVWTETVHVKND